MQKTQYMNENWNVPPARSVDNDVLYSVVGVSFVKVLDVSRCISEHVNPFLASLS